MLTLRAFDFRLFAYAFDPFIRADRRVARLTRPPTFKAARINIFTTAEKRSEQCDLVFWGGMTMNAIGRFH